MVSKLLHYMEQYNNFFESNGTLNNNFYKKQTLNLNLKKLGNGFKLNSNFRFFKKQTCGEFYLTKYPLNSNFYKKQTLKLNRMWWGEAMRKAKMKESLVSYRKFNLTPNKINLALLKKIKRRPWSLGPDNRHDLFQRWRRKLQRYDWTTKNPPSN